MSTINILQSEDSPNGDMTMRIIPSAQDAVSSAIDVKVDYLPGSTEKVNIKVYLITCCTRGEGKYTVDISLGYLQVLMLSTSNVHFHSTLFS